MVLTPVQKDVLAEFMEWVALYKIFNLENMGDVAIAWVEVHLKNMINQRPLTVEMILHLYDNWRDVRPVTGEAHLTFSDELVEKLSSKLKALTDNVREVQAIVTEQAMDDAIDEWVDAVYGEPIVTE